MVPRKKLTLMLALFTAVAGLAGCATTEESTDDTDPDADPGAGQVPFDDTNDDLGSNDEDLGDAGAGNETGETNETGAMNETSETDDTGPV